MMPGELPREDGNNQPDMKRSDRRKENRSKKEGKQGLGSCQTVIDLTRNEPKGK